MVKADVFALLSEYEGLPNTIYEALILGIPVLATNVGGIPNQIDIGETGWLVENNEEDIYNGIKHLLENYDEINIIRSKLKNYNYDNRKIMDKNAEIFSLN